MAYKRAIKNKIILTSDERTDYLKDKTLFLTATTSPSNNTIIKNNKGCLKATNSYETRYNIAKGHNLVITDCSLNTNSINLDIKGNINEANFILALINTPIIHSNTGLYSIAPAPVPVPMIPINQPPTVFGPTYTSSSPNNSINNVDPFNLPISNNLEDHTKWGDSGVFIDPNLIYINKEICSPLIYLKDPNNNKYYNLNLNNGSSTDLIETIKSNNTLINFNLNSNINLNSLHI